MAYSPKAFILGLGVEELMEKTVGGGIARFIYNNSMSIALLGMFLACLAGQSVTGFSAYNQALDAAHYSPIAFTDYLETGQFLDGVFSNWQAALLQLGVLIGFGSILRQKGAAHSRQPDEPGTPSSRRTIEWKFARRASLSEWLYANSLSLAFGVSFLVCFVAHAVFGGKLYNEDQRLQHLPPVPLLSYVQSADFAIAFYIVLSIFLRQEGSSESKPVEASNEQTGGANE